MTWRCCRACECVVLSEAQKNSSRNEKFFSREYFSSLSRHADYALSSSENLEVPLRSNMSCEIFFRIANESEHDKVLHFLRQHFFPEEPINNAYPIKDDSMEEEFILSLLPEGNILLAIESSTLNIAGLASFGKITRTYSQESWEESESTNNIKWRDILKFMSHIESKANVCQRFGVTEALHLHGVTVDKAYRGRAIGKQLFNECFKEAEKRNYRLVSADCTSIYSVRIAQSVGMECVSTVTYDEYNDKVGDNVFFPTPPHVEIKTFVKKI